MSVIVFSIGELGGGVSFDDRNMTITEIYSFSVEDTNDYLCVRIKEYPHAEPCFEVDEVLNDRDLQTKLRAWKIEQDAVDQINYDRQNTPATDLNAIARGNKTRDLNDTLTGTTIRNG